jgi:hypothetical protein
MKRLTVTYPWALAFWLVAASATAFLILAHALRHGVITLGCAGRTRRTATQSPADDPSPRR